MTYVWYVTNQFFFTSVPSGKTSSFLHAFVSTGTGPGRFSEPYECRPWEVLDGLVKVLNAGPGRFWMGSACREIRPSRQPDGTEYDIPPRRAALSRAAKASTSAHETVLGQAVSRVALAASMTWKPRRLGLLTKLSFSAELPGV